MSTLSGLEVGDIEIDGGDPGDNYFWDNVILPTGFFDFGANRVLLTFGVDGFMGPDIFCVPIDPPPYLVAPVHDLFLVPPGREC